MISSMYSAMKERAEAHAAELGVVARHELGVGLGQVERRARGLGEAGHQEDQEADELGHDEPDARLAAALRLDDVHQRQRAGRHHHAEQRQADRHLVGDQLRGGAHGAEERVLRARRPAAEHEARRTRASRRRRSTAARSARRCRRGRGRRPRRPAGPNGMIASVATAVPTMITGASAIIHGTAVAGCRLLLRQQLEHVGQRLHQAVGAHAVGPVARLEAAQQLALEQQ